MHPSHHAKARPAHPALVMAGSGESLTYSELEARSNQIAHAFRRAGLVPGDHIALQLENCIEYMPIIIAAQRSGLVYTPISTHLLGEEVDYIVRNCQARLLIVSPAYVDVAGSIGADGHLERRWLMRGDAPGFERFEQQVDREPITPIADEQMGVQMLYSSGTTGFPKGVLMARPPATPIDEPVPVALALVSAFGVNTESRYLSPAPLYHAAPLTFVTISLALGATIVIMEKFEAEAALKTIETHRITHSQWVPIMFVRMLKLPDEVRTAYDVSSLQVAIHAAAPCPVDIKHQMIDWWGPVIAEYYASTEGAGFTAIDSATWLKKPGSVGQTRMGPLHIVDDAGNELPAGEVGTIYFEGAPIPFEYFAEPEKTCGAYLENGWATVGDVGYLDEDGFLFLTDRKNYMIITGGVNVYPQEIENILITHPAVADAAVFGLPDAEFGERVHAVVQCLEPDAAGNALRDTLIAFLRERLSHIKVPRDIDFKAALPRHDNGKLYKRRLVDSYLNA